ncbi:hypothetical protein [Paenibacillus fonticola]|uniref:hypothetical protein n=1 Tax=Paenibacillus fonticola TaxID=379896 RepID=UPI0003661AAD|nr:hypothetical protein [Paenibacillus fonticola]
MLRKAACAAEGRSCCEKPLVLRKAVHVAKSRLCCGSFLQSIDVVSLWVSACFPAIRLSWRLGKRRGSAIRAKKCKPGKTLLLPGENSKGRLVGRDLLSMER